MPSSPSSDTLRTITDPGGAYGSADAATWTCRLGCTMPRARASVLQGAVWVQLVPSSPLWDTYTSTAAVQYTANVTTSRTVGTDIRHTSRGACTSPITHNWGVTADAGTPSVRVRASTQSHQRRINLCR